MGLDTKYRPLRYDDVLGQKSTKEYLRQVVHSRKGFFQSYLFAGPWGSGKTTLGRILGRSLLCASPVQGEPCDSCPSCRAILANRSESFIEFDAATNSGKDEIKKLTEDLQYSTFSGTRRLYLIDEAHRLSPAALDALLKPLEDEIPDTGEKRMVCIFATTEPEKMKATVLSRCAPAFVIQQVSPEEIAERLSWVCAQENIPCTQESLEIVAQVTECHIRDALKAVEGIGSLPGGITKENVSRYLHLSLYDLYGGLLLSLEEDFTSSLQVVRELVKRVSPSTIYEKLAELCLVAFQCSIGALKSPPIFWSSSLVDSLNQTYGHTHLLKMVHIFSSRPAKVSFQTLVCDLALAGSHYEVQGHLPSQIMGEVSDGGKKSIKKIENAGIVAWNKEGPSPDGVFIRDVAQKTLKVVEDSPGEDLRPDHFYNLLVLELNNMVQANSDGSAGSPNLGSSGIEPGGGAKS